MKFFRSCYRPIGTPAPPHEEANTNSNADVPHTVPSSRRSRRTGSKPASSKHWRPALSMISEDRVAPVSETNRGRVSGRKSSGEPRSLTNSRSIVDLDGSRNNSTQVIFPAFSPTPFMF